MRAPQSEKIEVTKTRGFEEFDYILNSKQHELDYNCYDWQAWSHCNAPQDFFDDICGSILLYLERLSWYYDITNLNLDYKDNIQDNSFERTYTMTWTEQEQEFTCSRTITWTDYSSIEYEYGTKGIKSDLKNICKEMLREMNTESCYEALYNFDNSVSLSNLSKTPLHKFDNEFENIFGLYGIQQFKTYFNLSTVYDGCCIRCNVNISWMENGKLETFSETIESDY